MDSIFYRTLCICFSSSASYSSSYDIPSLFSPSYLFQHNGHTLFTCLQHITSHAMICRASQLGETSPMRIGHQPEGEQVESTLPNQPLLCPICSLRFSALSCPIYTLHVPTLPYPMSPYTILPLPYPATIDLCSSNYTTTFMCIHLLFFLPHLISSLISDFISYSSLPSPSLP